MNKLGFGFLRLPLLNPEDDGTVDFEATNKLVDSFMAKGGNYFDTGYLYHNGNSEVALRECLVKRYPRESFRLVDKIPSWKVKAPEDCEKFFATQLERCGVEYFDTYMLHWLNDRNYGIAVKNGEFDFLSKLKAEGKAKAIGFSYHDNAEVLDKILTEQPQIDYVQLQINYLDWDSLSIEAAKCYEVAVKHGKKVIVMEPVKGGTLASLPEEAEAVLKAANPEASIASWGIRFASQLENVEIVLSGMNSEEQIADNMKDAAPFTEAEAEALAKAVEIIKASTGFACTGCNYCAPNCPMNIPIPQYFSMYNENERMKGDNWKVAVGYSHLSKVKGKASECIECGACEENCPQKLTIIENLKKVVEVFEPKR